MTSPRFLLHDSTLDQWGMGIVSGEYPEGSRIVTDDGEGGVQVSRTIAREAVRVLESMGLVTVRRRVGVTVNPAERWNSYDPRVIAWRLRGPGRLEQLHALSELRSAIEPLAARLAAQRAVPEELARLTEAAIAMVQHSRNARGNEYLAADARFHRSLLEASHNVMLAGLADVVIAVLEGRTHHDLMPEVADPTALRLHTEIAAAVTAGDGAAAEDAMRILVEESDVAVQAMHAAT